VSVPSENLKNFIVVKPQGKLDLLTELTLKKTLESLLLKKQFNIIVDFSKVTYINSYGLGVLTSVWREVKKANGRLILVNMNPKIKKIFQLTWLSKVFEIFDKFEEIEKEIYSN